MFCFQCFEIFFDLFHIFFQEHQAEADGQQQAGEPDGLCAAEVQRQAAQARAQRKQEGIGSTGAAMVSDDHGMLPSVSAKLIRRKVCEKNSVFCCVLAVEMLQDGKPTLIYAIVCKKPEENFAKENFMGHCFC